MEMPLEMHGNNIFYLYIGGKIIDASSYTYDSAKKVLRVYESFMLSLAKGTYEVKVISDAYNADPAITSLVVTNSVVTSFDANSVRNYRLGKDQTIDFNVDFSTATIKSLKKVDRVIDPSFYTLSGNVFSVSHKVFDDYYGDSDYTLALSNNDVYSFTIKSNVLFYTDYDNTTINNTTESQTGQNPLYQWANSTTEQIIDGTQYGFSGNVLQIIPNTVDNNMHCHGYFTLKSSSWGSTWYDVGYAADGLYNISFDYATVDTIASSTVEFSFKSASTSYADNLLYGPENDGKVHHYSTVMTGSQIGNGTFLWAYFNGGGGKVLVDDFKVASLDNQLTIGAVSQYNMTGDFSFAVADNGYYFDVYAGDSLIPHTYANGVVTISADAMKIFAIGANHLTIRTEINSLDVPFQVVDGRVAKLTDASADYVEGTADEIKLKGSFDSTISVTSITRAARSSDGGYPGDWEFYHCDDSVDYSSMAELHVGLNDSGYLLLKKDLLDKAIGQSVFTVSYSNGSSEHFTINSSRIEQSNYDDTTMMGSLKGGPMRIESPLSSGMGGSPFEIKEREAGNKALYVEGTNTAAASCMYTMRLHPYPWSWYTVTTDHSKLCRVRFTYAANNVGSSGMFFNILFAASADPVKNFFGEGYSVVDEGGNHEARWTLAMDGQVHAFDSGWFTYDDARVMYVAMPSFAPADGSYIMFDDLVFSQSVDQCGGLSKYTLGVDGDYAIPVSYAVSSLTIDGSAVAFTQDGGQIKVAQSVMNALAAGSHQIAMETNEGRFAGTFNVVTNVIATLTETSKTYTVGDASVNLAGQFSDGVAATSVTKYGSHDYDPSKTAGAACNATDITLSSTGMTIDSDIINYLYGTTTLVIVLNSGDTLTITLTNNRVFYCDFTHTTIWTSGDGNIPSIQDTNMVTFPTDGNGSTYLLYTPSNAVFPWSSPIGTGDCAFFTTKRSTVTGLNWTAVDLDDDVTYKIILDYAVTGASDGAKFMFKLGTADGTINSYEIAADGTEFTYEVKGSDLRLFCFYCLSSTAEARAAFSAKVYSLAIVKE
jgi:hypothetical protein